MKLSYVSRAVRDIRARWFFLLDMPEGNSFENRGASGLKGHVIVKRGTGNSVTIGSGTRFDGSIEIQGTRNTVVIGDNCHFRGKIVVKDHGQTVVFATIRPATASISCARRGRASGSVAGACSRATSRSARPMHIR
jgi:hypothetical protein